MAVDGGGSAMLNFFFFISEANIDSVNILVE